MSYYVYITRQSEFFVAEVPALPGCRTIGKTEAEVIENIRDVVRGYYQSLRKNNKAVPKVKVVKVSERVSTSRQSPEREPSFDPQGDASRVGSSSL